MHIFQKYFKDGRSLKDFISDYMNYCLRNKKDSVNLESLSLFLNSEVMPVLIEDEKFILKNVDKKYKYIGRGEMAEQLYLKDEKGFKHCLCIYKHLFQFIKERRRISN